MSTSLKTLITKLNASARMATQRAANLCLAHGHYEVDLEHLFLALLEQTDNDLARVLRANRISATAIQSDLEREIQTFKNGNTRTPVFSQHLQQLFQQAWLLASLDAHAAQIRSGHLLLALLTQPDLAQLAQRGSPLFAKIRLEDLKHDFDKLTDGSSEAAEAGAWAKPPKAMRSKRRPTRWPRACRARRPRSTSSPPTSRSARRTARSTRSSAATPRSARSSTS